MRPTIQAISCLKYMQQNDIMQYEYGKQSLFLFGFASQEMIQAIILLWSQAASMNGDSARHIQLRLGR